MQDLKIKMFNFKKDLEFEDSEVYELVNAHLAVANKNSTTRIVFSLNETLKSFTYKENVRLFLEDVNKMIEADPIYYNLEDICNTLESRDAFLHQVIIDDIRKIMNIKESAERKSAILSILPEYNWISEVQSFLEYYSQKPLIVTKSTSDPGARVENVYGLVERVDGGNLIFAEGQWFLVKENSIELGDPINHFQSPEKLDQIFKLQEAAKYGEISEGKIKFQILENFDLTLEESGLLLNGEAADRETTLESVYESGLMSTISPLYLDIIKEASVNMKKFMLIDIAKKVYNIGNPLSEAIVFNHDESMFVFFKSAEYGNDLYIQENAVELSEEIKGKFGADLYEFLQDKFPASIKEKKELEKEEVLLKEQVTEIEENIAKLEETELLGEKPELAAAHQTLLDKRNEVMKKLQDIRNSISA